MAGVDASAVERWVLDRSSAPAPPKRARTAAEAIGPEPSSAASSVPVLSDKTVRARRVAASEERAVYLDGFAELLAEIGSASKFYRRMTEDRETISGSSASVVAAFAPKPNATLAKRLCSLRLLRRWYRESGEVGFVLVESAIFEYVTHLETTGAPASRAQGLREALAFARGVLEIDTAPLDSTRVRGTALQGLERKGLIRQRAPLTVEQVRLLERVAADTSHADSLFAGACCFALYGRARVVDLRRNSLKEHKRFASVALDLVAKAATTDAKLPEMVSRSSII